MWLSGAQGVIEILPANTGPVLQLEKLPSHLSIPDVTETKPHLVLGSEQYSHLEELLMRLVGPIAPTLLRKVSAQAPSPQKLINSLAMHLQPHQRLEFEKEAISLLSESTVHPQETTSSHSLSRQEQAIDASFVSQCERELADLVGPIASFLIQKALKSHPHSLTELVNKLASNIPDPLKALEFQQRLRS